jgi:hypothetical protein
MTTTKISLQDVVGTICDALADLSPEDQARALEAVRLTLGIAGSAEPSTALAWGSPVAQETLPLAPAQEAETDVPLCDPTLLQGKPVKRLPMVVVQMVGDRPMVMGQQTGQPGRTVVATGPQRQLPRRVPAVSVEGAAAQAPCRGGYVLPRR